MTIETSGFIVLSSGPARSLLAKRSAICSEQIGNRVFPGKFLLDPLPAKRAHAISFGWIFEQPENLGGKIGDLISVVAVKRGFACAEPPLSQVKLNDRLPQRHVLHDLDHGRNVVHLAG